MTLPSAHSSTTTTTLRTVNMASDPGAATLISPSQFGIGSGTATLRAVSVAPTQFSQVQYVNGAVDGTAIHGNVRYLVPVQRASESYVMVNQAQPMLTPVYLSNVSNVSNVSRVSVSSLDETDHQLNINGQHSAVFSHPSSPVKSPEPPEVLESSSSSVNEVSITKINDVSIVKTNLDFEIEPVAKLDTRFFGELLAEVYRKNTDIYSCISEHVAKMRGRKHLLDLDYKADKEDIEHLIPKGGSELTKQQIRYLLQTRLTAEKTLRMLLSTFSSLREDLVHLQDDLRRLEGEKEQLERDLSFKADQAQQYDRLMESVRENNRQLQMSLKESVSAQRNLETQMMSSRSTDSSKDFRIKDLESSKRSLEQENELLRKKLVSQSSSSNLQSEDQTRQYEQMLKDLREQKEKELSTMRTQLTKIQTEYHTDRSSDKSLQLKITELMSKVDERDTTIRRLEEDIRRLQQQQKSSSSSGSVSQTIVTKKYQTQYPILGLLSDDYQYTSSPIKESKTIVIKTTGESTKKGYTT